MSDVTNSEQPSAAIADFNKGEQQLGESVSVGSCELGHANSEQPSAAIADVNKGEQQVGGSVSVGSCELGAIRATTVGGASR